MGEDGEGVGPDAEGIIMEPGVHAWCPGLHSVGEPEGQVTQGDDQVSPDHWFSGLLQHGEQQLEVLVAEVAADEHELGQGEGGAGPEVWIWILVGV